MYILNWNPDSQTLEASAGGYITRAESECFLTDLQELLDTGLGSFDFVLDLAAVSKIDASLDEVFEIARTKAKFAGASTVTFVARDDDEKNRLTDTHLQDVLEGTEVYVAFHLAA